MRTERVRSRVFVARAEEGEKERASMIESLKVCDVKHADMHQLQWMLSERCGHHTRARARAHERTSSRYSPALGGLARTADGRLRCCWWTAGALRPCSGRRR